MAQAGRHLNEAEQKALRALVEARVSTRKPLGLPVARGLVSG